MPASKEPIYTNDLSVLLDSVGAAVSSNDHVFKIAINDIQWQNLKIFLRKSRLLFLHLLNLHWQNFKAHCRREYNNPEQILFETRLKGSILRSCWAVKDIQWQNYKILCRNGRLLFFASITSKLIAKRNNNSELNIVRCYKQLNNLNSLVFS